MRLRQRPVLLVRRGPGRGARRRGRRVGVAELVEQEQVETAVAGHGARQVAFVSGFDEFVDELGGGQVANGSSLFAGGDSEGDEQMGLAGAGIAEQNHGFAAVDPAAIGQRGDGGGRDHWGGVEVEPGEGLRRGKRASFIRGSRRRIWRGVDLGGEQLREVGPVGWPRRGQQHPPRAAAWVRTVGSDRAFAAISIEVCAAASDVFTELHQRFWDTARTTKGDAEGNPPALRGPAARPPDPRRAADGRDRRGVAGRLHRPGRRGGRGPPPQCHSPHRSGVGSWRRGGPASAWSSRSPRRRRCRRVRPEHGTAT
jgi:hypothetical protein